MKQIVVVHTVKTIRIKYRGKEISHHLQNFFDTSWHYMELQENSKEIITSYDKFLIKTRYDYCMSKSKGNKRKYGDRYSYWYTDFSIIKFSDVNFISYDESTKYAVRSKYTLQDLIKNLPADEMIQYLKDNGLNVCPIVK